MEVENLSKYIGGKIKFYRNEKKLTQEELAKKLGTKKATISNYETGYRSPQQDMLFELAKVLEISINDLFPQTSVDENNSIEKIYNQLSPPRKEKVYNIAKQELKEQQEQNKPVIPIEKEKNSSDEIYTFAAHSDDPDKTYTDEEISEIEAFLDQVKADYDKKHNK